MLNFGANVPFSIFSKLLNVRPKKISCVSGSLPEKTRLVGRLYSFFYFFLLTVQNSSFPSSPPKKYRQCHQPGVIRLWILAICTMADLL